MTFPRDVPKVVSRLCLTAFVSLAVACGPKPPVKPLPAKSPLPPASSKGQSTGAALPDAPHEAAFAAHPTGERALGKDVVLHVVDVGTGLGVFVEGPDFTLVYDAGSNDDAATGDRNRFTAYLKRVYPELARIDHVVLSHPHRDHVGLLADVIADYDVGHVWDSGAINPICGYRRFIEAVAGSDIEYHSGASEAGPRRLDFGKEVCGLSQRAAITHSARIEEGKAIKLGRGATLTFLHVDGEDHGAKFNENSLVALVRANGASVLFMGDAEAGGRKAPDNPPSATSVEGYVLAHHADMIDADVLIAGHHGSKSSSRSAFIDAVSPTISIVSSGPMKYATVTLPDIEVVGELNSAGQLFRTDVDDDQCAQMPAKIGPDADGKAGGCTNIRITLGAASVRSEYVRLAD